MYNSRVGPVCDCMRVYFGSTSLIPLLIHHNFTQSRCSVHHSTQGGLREQNSNILATWMLHKKMVVIKNSTQRSSFWLVDLFAKILLKESIYIAYFSKKKMSTHLILMLLTVEAVIRSSIARNSFERKLFLRNSYSNIDRSFAGYISNRIH